MLSQLLGSSLQHYVSNLFAAATAVISSTIAWVLPTQDVKVRQAKKHLKRSHFRHHVSNPYAGMPKGFVVFII